MLYTKSIIGRKHSMQNKPNQDSVCCRENGATVIAVADGIGSRELSYIGARLAVETFCRYSLAHFTSKFTASMIHLYYFFMLLQREIYSSFKKENRCNKTAWGAFSQTTLIGAIILENTAYIYQMGDGYVVAKCNNQFNVLTSPSLSLENVKKVLLHHVGNKELLPGFVTHTVLDSPVHLKVYRLDKIDSLLLLTDGIHSLQGAYGQMCSPIKWVATGIFGSNYQAEQHFFEELLTFPDKVMDSILPYDDCSVAMYTGCNKPNKPR